MNTTTGQLQPDRVRKIRVLVLGDSGSGKTSLVHLIVNGEPLRQPRRTVGCQVSVKLVHYPECNNRGEVLKTHPHFVELWDVGTHQQYENLRGIFYSQVNGIILVHDLSSRRSSSSLPRWASEAAARASFQAAFPLPSQSFPPSTSSTSSSLHPHSHSTLPSLSQAQRGPSTLTSGPFHLPVPALIIGNKLDVSDAPLRPPSCSDASKCSSSFRFFHNMLFGLRSTQDLLPTSAAGQVNGDLRVSALRGVLDPTQIEQFFFELIERRYYSGGSSLISTESPQGSSHSHHCGPPAPWRDTTPVYHRSPSHQGMESINIVVPDDSLNFI
mmetsp:Transcript_22825/g.31799  ORF Transcript_22825/g.31799 Transcript_22825/m.31799 type:complete len:327 (+) Transcript_22825:301-1281(+)